jgi:hypothetical protein
MSCFKKKFSFVEFEFEFEFYFPESIHKLSTTRELETPRTNSIKLFIGQLIVRQCIRRFHPSLIFASNAGA